MDRKSASVLFAVLLVACLPLLAVESDADKSKIDFPDESVLSIDIVKNSIVDDRVAVSLNAGNTTTLYLSIYNLPSNTVTYDLWFGGSSGTYISSSVDSEDKVVRLAPGNQTYISVILSADREAN